MACSFHYLSQKWLFHIYAIYASPRTFCICLHKNTFVSWKVLTKFPLWSLLQCNQLSTKVVTLDFNSANVFQFVHSLGCVELIIFVAVGTCSCPWASSTSSYSFSLSTSSSPSMRCASSLAYLSSCSCLSVVNYTKSIVKILFFCSIYASPRTFCICLHKKTHLLVERFWLSFPFGVFYNVTSYQRR